MVATCIDNSYTWRVSLTVNKEYKVIRMFSDPHAGYPMVEVECDDKEIRPYRADRFILKQDA